MRLPLSRSSGTRTTRCRSRSASLASARRPTARRSRTSSVARGNVCSSTTAARSAPRTWARSSPSRTTRAARPRVGPPRLDCGRRRSHPPSGSAALTFREAVAARGARLRPPRAGAAPRAPAALAAREPEPPSPSDDPTGSRAPTCSRAAPDDRHVVVEMDDEGRAHLRFGDGELGARAARPDDLRGALPDRQRRGRQRRRGTRSPRRRRPPGRSRGVDAASSRTRCPARGGTEPEPIARGEAARARRAFRARALRAVTADDYAELAERQPAVQRAAAELRWTGSWYEVRVAVDPKGRVDARRELLEARSRRSLYPYRRIGHDLAVVRAQATCRSTSACASACCPTTCAGTSRRRSRRAREPAAARRAPRLLPSR